MSSDILVLRSANYLVYLKATNDLHVWKYEHIAGGYMDLIILQDRDYRTQLSRLNLSEEHLELLITKLQLARRMYGNCST